MEMTQNEIVRLCRAQKCAGTMVFGICDVEFVIDISLVKPSGFYTYHQV